MRRLNIVAMCMIIALISLYSTNFMHDHLTKLQFYIVWYGVSLASVGIGLYGIISKKTKILSYIVLGLGALLILDLLYMYGVTHYM
ncbi:hypothetical protein J416_14096 [Gracilibacillus halophilus YIM-C55.5]|uniref:Group-specific protein n=1 Tax=Gracilibacillus halophilus YIM-C55.5 TaxID=1308866 RepID=N4WMV4_9BACI|nr:hypothetical protein J416_14096 [Gracilibacillus halophilus YIM-C55.5]